MRRSFKTGVFLAALGIGVVLLLHPAPVQAQSDTQTPAMADLKKKQMAAAQKRADMQEMLDQDRQKRLDAADMSPEEALKLQKKLNTGSTFDLEARRQEREERQKAQKNTQEKTKKITTTRRTRSFSAHDETQSRAAPEYLKDSLELVESLKKKHAPYSPPPLKR